MIKDQIEYAVIRNVINILSILCAASPELIIKSLTGVLWDEEEESGIIASDGKFKGLVF